MHARIVKMNIAKAVVRGEQIIMNEEHYNPEASHE
jgi:hypothetical protein